MKQNVCSVEEIEAIKYGVWINDRFSWINDASWEASSKDDGSMVYMNKQLHLLITLQMNVLAGEQLQVMTVDNLANEKRMIKLFSCQFFSNRKEDCLAFFAPTVQALVHCLNDQLILLNGLFKQRGIVQYCTNCEGLSSIPEGVIKINPFSSDSSNSIYSLEGEIDANEQIDVYFWKCFGANEDDIINENNCIQLSLTSSENLEEILDYDQVK